ncbi:hypothetical protein K432DRAFT_133122 [Lepidopterella palustris CBS 459.81]|uniref:Uncharacterized protein n=1 Tax=Lepidopterella palustris CBS 459.81 TaxID=1314670 RepID=A0A8E2JCF2_9PEZI|nr:hypothetical protein K432DRAFT_133122 [Lepidopterella palustris CBS 459.81]
MASRSRTSFVLAPARRSCCTTLGGLTDSDRRGPAISAESPSSVLMKCTPRMLAWSIAVSPRLRYALRMNDSNYALGRAQDWIVHTTAILIQHGRRFQQFGCSLGQTSSVVLTMLASQCGSSTVFLVPECSADQLATRRARAIGHGVRGEWSERFDGVPRALHENKAAGSACGQASGLPVKSQPTLSSCAR